MSLYEISKTVYPL